MEATIPVGTKSAGAKTSPRSTRPHKRLPLPLKPLRSCAVRTFRTYLQAVWWLLTYRGVAQRAVSVLGCQGSDATWKSADALKLARIKVDAVRPSKSGP